MILIDSDGFKTLDSYTLESARQALAFKTGRFDFDITDQEVFDEIDEKLRHLDEIRVDKCIATGEEYEPVSFQEAAEYCMDDWGIYNSTISETRYAQKGNTFLTFPTM